MPKQTGESQSRPERSGRPHKMTGINIPEDLYVLMNRVAWERSRQRGGRASVSALIVELVERHRKELEKELAAASR
ncbi:MAG: hypothetical protein LC114_05825 [Bryobacterales bacterium]|nr:hypothetical protein [Bryobacterales bacterium]